MSTSGENLQNNQTNVKPPASNSNPIIPPGAVGKNPQSTLNPKGSTIFFLIIYLWRMYYWMICPVMYDFN